MISTAQNHKEHKATQTSAHKSLHAHSHNHRQISICLMDISLKSMRKVRRVIFVIRTTTTVRAQYLACAGNSRQ